MPDQLPAALARCRVCGDVLDPKTKIKFSLLGFDLMDLCEPCARNAQEAAEVAAKARRVFAWLDRVLHR